MHTPFFSQVGGSFNSCLPVAATNTAWHLVHLCGFTHVAAVPLTCPSLACICAPQYLHTLASVQVALFFLTCWFVFLTNTVPHLVHFCGVIHVAAGPGVWLNLGKICLPFSVPHLEHFVYFECPAVVQVAAFSG